MNRTWVNQIKDYGLGNFITMTPGLRLLSRQHDHRIPVFFETEGLGDLFLECPFIEEIGVCPSSPAPFTSQYPKRRDGESDYDAWLRIFSYGQPHPEPDPYVDQCDPPSWWKRPVGKLVAIAHGCLGNDRATIARKDVGVEVRQYMIDAVIAAGATPVVIGNVRDVEKFWNGVDLYRPGVDHTALAYPAITLRLAVGIMQACDAFITNATGLYHAGAASGMRGLVLWKDCDFEKNRAPSKKVLHSRPSDRPANHIRAIDCFLEIPL